MNEELIEGFDNFVIGNFQECLSLCRVPHGNDEFANFLWEALQARCELALDHMEAIRNMPRTNPALAGTAYFAVYQKSTNEAQKRAAFEKIIENASQGEPVACYYSCVARALGGDFIDAINYAQTVVSSSPSEFNALRVQFCLAIHRPDLASKIVEKDLRKDDSAAAKFVTAMLALITGKSTEAYLSYSDLVAQFGAESSLALANGRAVANIQRGHLAEAVEDLQTVLASNPADADSLVNIICCSSQMGKREEAMKFLGLLQQTHPNHMLVKKLESLRLIF